MLPHIGWSQLSYPVQKITEDGDTLVIMTKAQADQLTHGLVTQADYIKQLRLKYDKLKVSNLDLTRLVEDGRTELARSNLYNDSLINQLGDNMALLYKTAKSGEVHYVNLRYYTIDIFNRGTIVLNSTDPEDQLKIEQRLQQHPEWHYVDIANRFEPARRTAISYIQLYHKTKANLQKNKTQ